MKMSAELGNNQIYNTLTPRSFDRKSLVCIRRKEHAETRVHPGTKIDPDNGGYPVRHRATITFSLSVTPTLL